MLADLLVSSLNNPSSSKSSMPAPNSGASVTESDAAELSDADSNLLAQPSLRSAGLSIAIVGTTMSGSIMINVVSGPLREDSIPCSTSNSGEFFSIEVEIGSNCRSLGTTEKRHNLSFCDPCLGQSATGTSSFFGRYKNWSLDYWLWRPKMFARRA